MQLHMQGPCGSNAFMRSSRRLLQRAGRKPFASCTPRCTAQAQPVTPSPAETARTVVDLASEGTLSTTTADGSPLGTPVIYSINKAGLPVIQIDPASLELNNLRQDARCSLLVQPITFPARAIASVALQGTLQTTDAENSTALQQVELAIDKCLYFGGLDQSSKVQEVSGDEFRAAEPDVLRKVAAELVKTWNEERAEDIYRIVADFQKVALMEMNYAELLWVDRLGMYIRSEVSGREPEIVRVPFYRPVNDERDARSVITMAAQMAWERERPYTPPVPPIFADAAANN